MPFDPSILSETVAPWFVWKPLDLVSVVSIGTNAVVVLSAAVAYWSYRAWRKQQLESRRIDTAREAIRLTHRAADTLHRAFYAHGDTPTSEWWFNLTPSEKQALKRDDIRVFVSQARFAIDILQRSDDVFAQLEDRAHDHDALSGKNDASTAKSDATGLRSDAARAMMELSQLREKFLEDLRALVINLEALKPPSSNQSDKLEIYSGPASIWKKAHDDVQPYRTKVDAAKLTVLEECRPLIAH